MTLAEHLDSSQIPSVNGARPTWLDESATSSCCSDHSKYVIMMPEALRARAFLVAVMTINWIESSADSKSRHSPTGAKYRMLAAVPVQQSLSCSPGNRGLGRG